MAVVVDTNVAVVANGRSEQASANCVKTCAERLGGIMRGDVKLVLDNRWIILREYMQNLRSNGADVGDRFLGWILVNKDDWCDSVSITPVNALENEYEEFPDNPALEDFDRDDRKFIAVALAHPEKPPILQATDTHWWDFRNTLYKHGVRVEFICEDDIQRLREES